jgi:hypothetical protein
MTKQAIVLVLLSGALAASGGCGVCQAIVHDPFGPGTHCVGPRCGPGPMLAEPCEDPCGECGAPACACRCRLVRGPLSFVFALFTAGSYRGCWGGCGERYWGDWYGDPPACCDPCDCNGHFTGGEYPGFGGDGGIPAGMAAGRMANPSYDEGVISPQPDGCRSCGQGGHASHARGTPRYPAMYHGDRQQFAAQQPSGVPRTPMQASSGGQRASSYASRGQRYPARNPSTPSASGSYAPRLISTTDRVVKPATPDQGPHLAQPQRADVVQE